jgi:hypothetical protein
MRDRRGACRVLVGDLRERDCFKEEGIGGRIILKWTFMKWDGSMDWIDLAEDRDRWRILVNAIVNLRVP